MRQYGQIQCAIWANPRFKALSEKSKLILIYLLTGRHSNGLGCFSIPFGYVSADLKYGIDTVSKGFTELYENGFIKYCETTEYVFICKFLKWNPIANPKIATSREKEFSEIPSNFEHIQELASEMLKYGKHFGNGFETVLQTVSKQERRGEDRIGEEPKGILSGKPDPAPESTLPKSIAISTLEYLNEKSNKNFRPVDSNIKLIASRVAEGADLDDLKSVIDLKCKAWLKDSKMNGFLRPKTLFNATNFDNYLGQVGSPQPLSNEEELDALFGEDPVDESDDGFFDGEWSEVANA